MRLPKLFVPEDKDIDKKLESLLQENKTVKKAQTIKKVQIGSIDFLTGIPEEIGNYTLKTGPQKIYKKDWTWYFDERIPDYIVRAVEMTYQKPLSTFFTSIYILEFKSTKAMDEADRKLNMEKEINDMEVLTARSLRKDNYLVVIKANKCDKDNSLKVIGDYYINNFGLEDL